MQIETLQLDGVGFNTVQAADSAGFNPQVVFVFGDTDIFKQPSHYEVLRERYPQADILGCSSSGNVLGAEVSVSPMIVTAVEFDSARAKLVYIDFDAVHDAREIQNQLIELVGQLEEEDLKHLFVLSDGLNINGSDLVRGFDKVSKVPVTGGMAGDGERFSETWVIANDEPKQNRVAILALYGDALVTDFGSYGGWSEFGAERTITKSVGNVLYEIDGKPALDLYKEYLGSYASGLPNSGLRFPLSIKKEEGDPEVIRTLLGVNEDTKSIIFAGDVPEGFKARLMKPDLDVLIDGAGVAAQQITKRNDFPALGLVVSCVGRKIIMGQMVEEELDAVEDILGDNVLLAGFYSYGEFSPVNAKDGCHCSLHNQTMTLTTIFEDI